MASSNGRFMKLFAASTITAACIIFGALSAGQWARSSKGLERQASSVVESTARDRIPMYAAFCNIPVPKAAVVDSSVVADYQISVTVPSATPKAISFGNSTVTHIQEGKIVEFRVSSPREGALAVHGLSSFVLITPGAEAVVRFRAIYSGRFSLHFHGADGSHFEAAVLEITE